MNHLTLGVYLDGSYEYNVVCGEDLEHHIEYNRIWRPGRLLYVDGDRVFDGCIRKEALSRYDEIARKFFEGNSVDMSLPTIPYR